MENRKDKIVKIRDKSFILKAITPKLQEEAIRVEKIAFSKAFREGAMTNDEALNMIKERGLVKEEEDKRYID